MGDVHGCVDVGIGGGSMKAAIAYFEDAVRETDEIMDDCSPALQAELSEQRAHFVKALETMRASEWVSVSKGPPEVDKYGDVNVLVHLDDGFISSATYDKNNGWELWADAGEVTHWMYHPAPPAMQPRKEV